MKLSIIERKSERANRASRGQVLHGQRQEDWTRDGREQLPDELRRRRGGRGHHHEAGERDHRGAKRDESLEKTFAHLRVNFWTSEDRSNQDNTHVSDNFTSITCSRCYKGVYGRKLQL